MWNHRELIAVLLVFVITVSFSIAGLNYAKLDWTGQALAQDGTYNPPEDPGYLDDGSLPVSQAVVGMTVEPTQLYWQPNSGASLRLMIDVGLDFYVVGISEDGAFYYVVPFPTLPWFRLWMPVDSLAPSFNAAGAELPNNPILSENPLVSLFSLLLAFLLG